MTSQFRCSSSQVVLTISFTCIYIYSLEFYFLLMPQITHGDLKPHGLYSPWNSPGQNTEEGSLSLLQRIFPTQGSKPGLLHCRWFLNELNHKGSPIILEWVACPFSTGSSRLRNWTRASCIESGFFYQLSYQGSPIILKGFTFSSNPKS